LYCHSFLAFHEPILSYNIPEVKNYFKNFLYCILKATPPTSCVKENLGHATIRPKPFPHPRRGRGSTPTPAAGGGGNKKLNPTPARGGIREKFVA